MSSVSNVIELPVRHVDHERVSLEYDIVLALATADDLASAMVRVVESVHRSSGATRVEWWAKGDDGALQLGAAIGIARGRRHDLPLGRAGAFVLLGGSVEPEIASALMTAAPIIRRRAAEERLARTVIDLARRNEALEDFAALVAHELKTPLQAALLADHPSRHLEDALDLVDALLEAARSEPSERVFVSAEKCLDQAVEDLGAEVEVTTDLQATLPLPPGPLRVLLRNLLSNAVLPAPTTFTWRRSGRRARGGCPSMTMASVLQRSIATQRGAVLGCRSPAGSPAVSAASSSWPRTPPAARARCSSSPRRRDDQRPDRRRSRAPAGGSA